MLVLLFVTRDLLISFRKTLTKLLVYDVHLKNRHCTSLFNLALQFFDLIVVLGYRDELNVIINLFGKRNIQEVFIDSINERNCNSQKRDENSPSRNTRETYKTH